VTTEEPAAPPAPGGGPARRLWHRVSALVHELGKFGTVGAVAFAVDLLIYNALLLGYDLETLTAKTISTCLAATVAFTGNRFWTWRHRQRSGLGREYVRYFLLNTIGLGIGLTCLALSHYGLGSIWPVFTSPLADNISGQLVGTAVGTLFRFWSYRRFVFLVPIEDHPADLAGLPTPESPAAVSHPPPRVGNR
jgi:putative flippase GtrA